MRLGESWLPSSSDEEKAKPIAASDGEGAVRIGLLGQFGSGNSGNDGSLEAMVDFLRRAHPDAELVCICSRPDIVTQELAIEARGLGAGHRGGRALARANRLLLGAPQRLLNLTEALRGTRGLDWLIVPGTGILDDFQENPFGWPFMLWRWCVAARLNGVRIALVSIGAGPIHHPLSRRFMVSAARLASYRSYRDTLSREYMRKLRLDTSRDAVFPDLAFGLPAPLPASVAPRRNLIVGLGVMSYRGWLKSAEGGESIHELYLTKLARFALKVLDDGHHLRLLTGDKGDLPAVEAFHRRLSRLSSRNLQICVTSEPTTSLSDLMRQLQETDIVVASRYHNVVCALKLGIPTISLSYASKNDVLMRECGLGDFCQHIESFDVGVLAGQFGKLLAKREECAARLNGSLAGIARELSRQESLLSATLGRRAFAAPVATLAASVE